MDQDLLKDLLDRVAQKFGYTEPDQWQDGLFVSLSEEIEKETRFIISRNTLKRLYGKIKTSEHYNPQIDTRNALAKYAGYPDWNKFRMEMVAERAKKDAPTPGEGNSGEGQWESPNRSQPFSGESQGPMPPNSPPTGWNRPLFLGILGVLVVALLAYRYWPKPKPDYSRIKISVENPVDTAPFTLVVNYEIPSDLKDSIYLGVGGSRFFLKPDKKSYVHSLSLPIYSFVYLWTKDRHLIRAIPIKAYSRDLECYYETYNKKTLLVPHEDFLGESVAGLKRSYFAKNNLDSTDFRTTFYKVKDFAIDADNFTLQLRYKVDASPRICELFQVKLYADSGHHELEINNKGCAQYNFVAPAEKYFGGKFENLTKLSAEPGNWHDLEMEVRNKKFRIILDGTERFSTTYKKTMGMTNVLRIQFNGFGQIDYYRMLDTDGQIVEREEF